MAQPLAAYDARRMKLTIHTTNTAPDESRPVLEGIQADLGFIPNLAASTATSPALLAGFDGLRRAVAATKVDPVDREVAGLATGVVVGNRYGVAFHSTVLANLGVDEDDLAAMRAGRAPSGETRAAVYEFAKAVAETRGRVDQSVIDRLTATGASHADVLDLLTECAFASLVGLIDNLAGGVTLDPFLAPRAWTGEGH
jgi:alkylhydroperoxidase family enzyme